MTGVFFHEEDIKEIVEKNLDWAEVVEGQVFCAHNVMNDNTPIGTSIIVGVDGLQCKDDDDTVTLILSSGTYVLQVKTKQVNDDMTIRFDKTIPVPGTFGRMENGVLDILTDEEKEFKAVVDEHLGNRDDEYAQMFRRDNVRNIGGRGHVLLEKIKAEIKDDEILMSDGITPTDLVCVFIEMTEKFVNAQKNIKELTEKHDVALSQYHDTYVDGTKQTRRFARDVEVLNRKIDSNKQVGEFCMDVINAAVLPVLNSVVER